MTRDIILKEVTALKSNNILLELPTGLGKSRLAIERIKSITKKDKTYNLLVVVPRNVLKKNWQDEFTKWWPSHENLYISYVTYVSLAKEATDWDFVIFDEAHHLSEKCREILASWDIKHSILCSATIGKELKKNLYRLFNGLEIYKKDIRESIENDILPDPKVYLMPLELDNNSVLLTEIIIYNKKATKRAVYCSFADRWKYIRAIKDRPIIVHCTEKQYLVDLNSQIDYWKKRFNSTRSIIAKNKWLQLCSERLKWLSEKKTKTVLKIINHLKPYRTLTFCNNIEQTKLYGENCINSKNKFAVEYLRMFNEGIINHITACNMLNEGMNLVNCQVGIYANLNSSETIVKQRMGRLLRHPNPVVVIPYYKDSREEELVKKMLENYNHKLIKVISKVNEIKI